MADKKISALSAASTPLAGTEVLPIVQSGSTVKVAVSNLTAGRAVSADSLTLTGSALSVGNGGTGATSFTSGRILFGNAASAVATSTNLFWDNANNRFGLGTSTPDVKSHFLLTGGASSTNWSWVGANSLNPPAACTYGLLTGGNLSQGNSEANLVWGSGISSSQYFAIGKWSGTAYTEQTRMTYDGSWLCGTTQDYGVSANGWYFAKGGFVWANDNTASADNRNWNAGVNGYANGAWQLTVSGANNTWPNAAYAFAVTRDGSCYNTTGTYGTLSDARFKENVADARGYADDLMKVRVVKYSLKDEQSGVATKLGVIAQELEQLFPGLIDVGTTPQGEEFKSVKMTVFIPMLIKAFQELKQEVDALKKG